MTVFFMALGKNAFYTDILISILNIIDVYIIAIMFWTDHQKIINPSVCSNPIYIYDEFISFRKFYNRGCLDHDWVAGVILILIIV